METTNLSNEGIPLVFQQTFEVAFNEERLVKIVVAIFMSLLFIFINSIMFHTLLSKPVFRELPRYILFAHMLCNDTVQLIMSPMFYMLFIYWQKIPKTVCSFLMVLAAATTNINPLNLGVMSLERYVAICFPLRHSEMATQKLTTILIAIIWFLGSISIVIDILYALMVNPLSFKNTMFCTREMFIFSQWQKDLYEGLSGFFFVAVTAIIIFTYISVIVAARSASDKESAKKAWKTVLLHFGQLILSLNSLLYGIIERFLLTISSHRQNSQNLRFMNFLFVLTLPRCLSPLIYGLRDEAVRPLFLYYFRRGSQKIEPSVAH